MKLPGASTGQKIERVLNKEKKCTKCGQIRRVWKAGMCYWCANHGKTIGPTVRTKKEVRGESDLWKEIKKCDLAFSQLIRIEAADSRGIVKCFTCGQTGVWKNDVIQCGHFEPRSNMGTRWYRPNCKPQCKRCNETLKGNLETFADRLRRKHGQDIVETLHRKAKEVSQVTAEEVRSLRLSLEKEVKRLKEEKGL